MTSLLSRARIGIGTFIHQLRIPKHGFTMEMVSTTRENSYIHLITLTEVNTVITPAPRLTPIKFDNIGVVIAENKILEYLFGIDCYEYGFEYGMYVFWRFFFIFSQTNFGCFLWVGDLHLNYYPLDHCMFLFF